MTLIQLESCLIMIDKSLKDKIPTSIFETEDYVILTKDLSYELYKFAMKIGVSTNKFKIGDNSNYVEFFDIFSKKESNSFLNFCDELIFSKLQASAPSLDVCDWKRGVLAPEADDIVARIQKLLDLRKILRNYAVLNDSNKKKKNRLILHYSEINSCPD